ncbi:MAG: hypothetical protein IJW03_05650 [Clostridia bacterium]|nr:hypothetical protein [Clostridia bacterium]
MKRVSLLLCLVLTLCALAACSAHEHDYSTEWSADSVGHWHDALCDCENAEVVKEDHTDSNNDGACDVCEFTDHTHTYSSKWVTNATHHWNAADCGHTAEGNKGAHEDNNNDGACDTCAMVMGDASHVHTFSDNYSYDDTHHWKNVTCEHTGAKVTEIHVMNAGICTVCSYGIENIDTDNVAALLAAAMAQRKNVASGTMLYTRGGQLTPLTEQVSYVLGKNATHISSHEKLTSSTGVFDTYTETWLEQNGDKVFAVQTLRELKNGAVSGSDGTELNVVAMTPERLYGPYLPHSSLTLEETSAYYIEAVLSTLYSFSQSEMAREVDISNDKSARKVTFDFGYLVINAVSGSETEGGTQSGAGENEDVTVTTQYTCYYYVISGYFVYSESLAITEAKFTINAYSDQTLDKEYEGDQAINPDFIYDRDADTVTFTADAAADTYDVYITQTEGERIYKSKYPQSELIPTQFELEYNGKTVGDSITLAAGGALHIFSFGSMIPSTADSKFINVDKISCDLINNSTGESVFMGVMMINGSFSVCVYKEGTYTLEYTYNGTKRSCQITAVNPTPTSVETFVLHKVTSADGSSSWLEVSTENESDSLSGAKLTYSVAVGETLYFLPKTLPLIAEQGYTFSFTSATASVTTATLNNVMVFGEIMDSYEFLAFKATAKGTYVINYTSTVDTSITGTFTVTVE